MSILTGLTGGNCLLRRPSFDDTALPHHLIATAAEQGATLLNYAKVTALNKGSDGIVDGVDLAKCRDLARLSAHRQKLS